MKKFLFTLLALAICGGTRIQAQSAQAMQPLPFDMEVTKGVLPNGMTYFIQHNDNPKQRAFFYIVQKVGSVQEEEEQRGLAHFLEHMCFNGSEHFKGNGVVNFCQRIGVRFGADLNAYTAADETVYNINNVPTDNELNLDSCLLILYDWSHSLTLDEKEIDKERGVIHEEWRMRTGAFMRILERQMPTLFPGSKYGQRLPIGLMSVVDNFKPEVLRAYYEKWYRPDLQAIVVVGDIDVQKMEEKIKSVFSGIKNPENEAKFEYFDVPDNNAPIIVVDKDKEVTTPNISVMLKHDRLPREMRNTIAALPMNYVTSAIESMFSYRFDDLKQDPNAPFNSIYAGDNEYILASTKKALSFDVDPKEGKSEEALASALREVIRASKYGFTESEFDRAKKQYLSDLDQAKEARKKIKSQELVQECVRHFLDNSPKMNFDQYYQVMKQVVQAISLEIVNQYAKELIGEVDTNLVIMGIYPERENVTVPEVAQFSKILASVKAEDIKPYEAKTVDTNLLTEQPKAGTIKKELPEDKFGYKGLILSNGVKVLYKKTDFDESRILMSAVSKGGSSKLALNQMADADMFNAVIAENGLGRFNGNELRKALTGRQVSISHSVEMYNESVNGHSSPKDLRTLMQLLYLSFTELNYDTINFRTVMTSTRQELANKDADPRSSFSDSIQTYLYNKNPRTLPMTLDRLNTVTYDGIRKIFEDRFNNAADFTFIFTGNVDEDSLRIMSQAYLASLPTNGKFEKTPGNDVNFWKGMKECRYKKKMETPMSILLQVWQNDLPTTVKNLAVSRIAGSVYDDLNLKTIREQYSFAYSVNSMCAMTNGMKQSKVILQTVCPVKPEKCDSALLIAQKNLEELASKGAEEEVLKKSKEQLLKAQENNLRENSYWQRVESRLILNGIDEHTGMKEALEATSNDDIRKFVNNVILKGKNRLNVILLPE